MKKKCLIVVNSMIIGGIQKSLLSFLDTIKDFVEVDILVTDKTSNAFPLPSFINELCATNLYSIRKALKFFGICSKEFALSLVSIFSKKRWLVIPKLKKQYDIAICYSHVGYGKYYTIDKVNADRKYVFYHNGAYEETGKIKEFDKEYYPKYTSVIAVSEHIGEMLLKEISKDLKIEVIHNLIDIDEILQKAEEPCEIKKENDEKIILTVGRISFEKRTLIIPEICKELKEKNFKFKWYIVGSGPQIEELKNKVYEYGLEDTCIICGAKQNPYPYMKNCDIYAQFSKYESEGITIKEVLCFNKPCFLSKIEAFEKYKELFKNVYTTDLDIKSISNLIINTGINNKSVQNIYRLNEMVNEDKGKIRGIINE